VVEVAPMSRRLSRYIWRRLAAQLVISGLAVAAVMLALDGLERASVMLANQLTLATAVTYLALRLATVAHLLVPLVACLAVALTIAALRHRGEWDAMRSLGAGPAQQLTPFVVFAAVLAAGLAGYENYGLPRSIERAARYEASQVLGGADRLGTGEGPRWWRLTEGILVARGVTPSGDVLSGVSWMKLDGAGQVLFRIDAEQLVHDGEAWSAHRAQVWEFAGPAGLVNRSVAQEPVPLLGLTPGGIRRRLLPLAQSDLPMLASDPSPQARFTLHSRFAHALASGLLVLLVVVLTAGILPRGRALSAAISIGLMTMVVLATALGNLLAPGLGWPVWLSWVVPALLAAAVYLTWKYEAWVRNQPLVQSA